MTRYTDAAQLTGLHPFKFATYGLVAVFLIFVAQANATPVPAGATVIFDADGFEPPYDTTFLGTGQLEGQLPGPQPWLRDLGPAAGTANVQSTIKHSGAQAVQVDRAANDDDRWAVPVNGWPSKRFVCIEWDMRVEPTVGPAGTFGPFFGIEGYDNDGVGAEEGLLGSMGVDASTGDVLYQTTVNGHLTETGTKVSFGEWNHFHLDFDFALHEYSLILNGATLVTEPFVDGAGLDQFTDGDIAALGAAGDAQSQALTGVAYFDNFVEYELETKIPEPSTLLMSLMALVGLPRKRKASL